MDLMAGIRSASFDLDELDNMRHRVLHKRALLLAAAFDSPDLNRMEIAMAAGVTLNRAYAIANQGRGITDPRLALEHAVAESRLIESREAVDLWGEDAAGSEWLAFPYFAGDE